MDTLTRLLTQNAIVEIDDEDMDQSAGWTSFEDPFTPDFSGSTFVMGSQFIFSFRMDKKVIPSKVINKKYRQEMTKRLKESGKDFFSRNEKKQIKEDVIREISIRIPATPNVFDILWNYEKSIIWFFSTQKSANEAFEIFFTKTFKLNLVRRFPYTAALESLTDSEKDLLNRLTPSHFME
ncbi:MAG: recombination-associated protein RdgC [Deltaproteobacteria bacterium]|nr:recombination-associated protein RdgC [Deltaproteobacteria bacterium]